VTSSGSSKYYLTQDFVVAEATILPFSTTLLLEIKAPKYGGNIEVIFQSKNKNHFIAKRDGNQIAAFEMISDSLAYLDIAKGEKRNFAFAFMALFVIWFENSQVNNIHKEVSRKNRRSRSKAGESGDSSKSTKSGKDNKSGKEKTKKVVHKEESIKNSLRMALSDISDTSEKSGASELSGAVEHSEETSEEKLSRVSSRAKSPRLPSIPSVGLGWTVKSPRASGVITQPLSSRREQSSNSVLNALLQRNRSTPRSDNNSEKNDVEETTQENNNK